MQIVLDMEQILYQVPSNIRYVNYLVDRLS